MGDSLEREDVMTDNNEATVTTAAGRIVMAGDRYGPEIKAAGLAFTMRIVRKGDRWGLNDALTHNLDDPYVEFYDQRYTKGFGPRGQFVSRYYLSTLVEDRERLADGLDLYGGVASWSLDRQAMREMWAQLEEWDVMRERTN